MVLTGVDEAGLGPILGPYCLGMCSFTIEGGGPTDLFTMLRGVVGQAPGGPSPIVCDSKKLFGPSKGLAALEESVLTFYSLLHGEPADFRTFLEKLGGRDSTASMVQSPWLKDAAALSLPLESHPLAPAERARMLKRELASRGAVFSGASLALLPAREFNDLLGRFGNKGEVCRSQILPLLSRALEEKTIRVTVDRQGGRRYYGDWLVELLPGEPLQALEEGPGRSVYLSGEREIGFYVKGDALAMETALASLFAKYARECAMILFNRYWEKRAGDIKPTAGYYTDGKRFIDELDSRGLLPRDRDVLIRRR